MIEVIAAALLWLAPHLDQSTADKYADIIAFESRWYKVHPFLVLSLGYWESQWINHRVSPTNDYGLLQIHVNSSRSNRFYRRETELFDPRVNIREGVRILSMWKRFHNKWCAKRHPYWAHYKWGRRVRGVTHARKVRRLFVKLVRKFGKISRKGKLVHAW